MKDFIEKLIKQLEERIEENVGWEDDDFFSGQSNAFEWTISIINKLAEEYEREHIVDLCNQICGKVDSIIKKDNNGWILCSERLPDKSGEYLTYVDYADETFIAIDEIDCDGIMKEWNCTPNYHVIAWQPLPKPYK